MNVYDYVDPAASGTDLLLGGSNRSGVPGLLGGVQTKPSTWLDYHPPAYIKNLPLWRYARDHYDGSCASILKITRYLIRKGIGEPMTAFQERVALSDYTPYFAHIVDSLAGMMFGVELDATRTFGKLGETDQIGSPIGKLWIDADGDRNGYRTLWNLLTVELIAIHDGAVFVDGGVDGTTPRVRLIPAEAIVNWRYENGVLIEALLREINDTRTSIQDDPDSTEEQFILMTVDGWQRWRKVPETEQDKAIADGNKSGLTVGKEKAVPIGEVSPWYYETPNGKRTIPLVPVSLPLKRHVGYLLAKKANAIFNKESERDHLLRFGAFPLLNVHGNDGQYKKVIEALAKGARAIQVPSGSSAHAFIAPSPEPARIISEAIVRKVDELYTTGFREYSAANSRSSGNSKTATEVKYDLSTGIAAFLTMLKSALDDAENTVLGLLEQTVFPKSREKWFLAHVERSDDFVPFDINEVVERLRTRYFGQAATVPVGRQGRINAAQQIADWDGLETDEREIAADVDMAALLQAFQLYEGLEIPPEAKAEMAVRFLVSTGYVNPDTKVLGKDGKPTDILAIEKLRKSALELAKKPVTEVAPAPTPQPPPGGTGAAPGGAPAPAGGTPAPKPGSKPQPKTPVKVVQRSSGSAGAGQ